MSVIYHTLPFTSTGRGIANSVMGSRIVANKFRVTATYAR